MPAILWTAIISECNSNTNETQQLSVTFLDELTMKCLRTAYSHELWGKQNDASPCIYTKIWYAYHCTTLMSLISRWDKLNYYELLTTVYSSKKFCLSGVNLIKITMV